MNKTPISRRRPLLAGALGFCVAGPAVVKVDAAAAEGAQQTLIARQEMAVQVVDIGWKRETVMFDTAGMDGAVTNEIYTLETSAHHIRFRFQNGLAEPWTIAGAVYAPTARAQNDPIDGGGAAVALRAVTFGNAGADVAPADQAAAGSAPRSLTLPPASQGGAFEKDGYTFRGRPQQVFSDWMPIDTLSRADGFSGFLVMLRVFTQDQEFTGVRPTRIGGHGLFQGTPARPWRTLFLPARQGGGLNSLTKAPFPAPEPFDSYIGNGLCCGVQAIGLQFGLTLLSVGDSVLMGGGETQGYLGPIRRAADMMSTPALPVSHIQAAIYGGPSGAFFTAGEEALRTNEVSCAFIQVVSGNDPHTTRAAQESLARAVALADFCKAQGVVSVFCSPGAPTSQMGQSMRDLHWQVLMQLNELAGRGYALLNFYKILSGDASDDENAMAMPNLRAEDHVHLNTAGNTLVAEAAVSLLKKMSISHG